MAVRPRGLSNRPTELDFEDPRGDVLADVLGVALIRHSLYRRLECGAPWGFHMTASDRALFYLIARGTAILDVDGEVTMTLSAGDVAFIPHGTPHTFRDAKTTKAERACDGKRCGDSATRRIGGDGATTSIIAGFYERGPGRSPLLLERLSRVITLSTSDASVGSLITSTVQLVLAESATRGPASALVLQRLADVLFVQVLRAISGHQKCRHAGLAALSDPPIHEALSLMHLRVHEDWTVEKLASRVGLSRSGFSARFTELVGEPPLQYLARWRMARAAELLRADNPPPIGEIATRVGYESVPSFTKAFKRWQGTSPAAFRRDRRAARAATSPLAST